MEHHSKLNAAAPEFVPGSYTSTASWASGGQEDATEEQITAEELAELEAAEEWVALQAEFEEFEEEHVIATALR